MNKAQTAQADNQKIHGKAMTEYDQSSIRVIHETLKELKDWGATSESSYIQGRHDQIKTILAWFDDAALGEEE